MLITSDKRTLPALAELKYQHLAALLGVWILALSIDSSAMWLLIRGVQERVRFPTIFRTVAVRLFFNVITPFGVGGQPISVVLLSRDSVPAGKSTTVTVTRFMMLSLITQVGAVVAMVLFRSRLGELRSYRFLFTAAGVLGVGTIAVIVTSILSPRLLVIVVTRIGKLLARFKLIEYGVRFKRLVVRETITARKSFQDYFTKHRYYLFGAATMCLLLYLCQLLTLRLILYALNLDIDFLSGIIASSILLFIVLFMPTPGAVGLGEIVFVIIFGRLVPTYLLGVAVLLWRVFYQYLSAVLGGLLFSKYFSDLVVKKVSGRDRGDLDAPQSQE